LQAKEVQRADIVRAGRYRLCAFRQVQVDLVSNARVFIEINVIKRDHVMMGSSCCRCCFLPGLWIWLRRNLLDWKLVSDWLWPQRDFGLRQFSHHLRCKCGCKSLTKVSLGPKPITHQLPVKEIAP